MKKNVLAVFMAAVMAFGSVQGVFAQETEANGEIEATEEAEAETEGEYVKIIKEDFERFDSQMAYKVFDENEFKLASVLNNSVEKNIFDAQTELTKQYKMNMQTIEFLYNTYQSVYTMGDIISVVMHNENYTGGAHGYQWLTAYVGYKDNDELLKFEDLFKDKSKYVAQMKKIINAKIAENPTSYYQYYESCVDKCGFDNRFYFDDSGNLVIFYQPYDIAPYAAGIRTFKIYYKELLGIIKPEIYNLMRIAAQSPKTGSIMYNGTLTSTKNPVRAIAANEYYDMPYVPVRDVFELMGVEVKWNAADGVVLNNLRVLVNDKTREAPKFVYDKDDKNIFDSFESLPTTIVDGYKLGENAEIKNINGVSYISFSDLKNVLSGGFVTVDQDEMINIYY